MNEYPARNPSRAGAEKPAREGPSGDFCRVPPTSGGQGAPPRPLRCRGGRPEHPRELGAQARGPARRPGSARHVLAAVATDNAQTRALGLTIERFPA